jgi:uncharacterized membrane protein YjjP (DUF1212 family)
LLAETVAAAIAAAAGAVATLSVHANATSIAIAPAMMLACPGHSLFISTPDIWKV